ncbi:MAG: hypothetical protein JO321_00695 [Solirubrobacterales bacterium]|nr:hypothetical protein [Solirubrobacterales bacterium]MBV9533911.1 hypothetical protein [Solirubrobacterales bacterium]
MARGWSARRAERELRIGNPYMQRLEPGERCPSVALTQARGPAASHERDWAKSSK